MPYRERGRGPRPAAPVVTVAALVFALCAALTAFTSHKLAVMARLRGWSPGAPSRVMRVVGVRRRFNASAAEYNLLDGAGGEWAMQLTRAQIERIGFHEPVVVRCLDAERECFVPDSVYIDEGNFGFDRTLLAMEVFGLLASGLLLAWRVRRWRGELRAWAQQAAPVGPSGLS